MEIDSFKRKKQYSELAVIHKRLSSDLTSTSTVNMSTVVQSVPPLFIKDSDVGVPTLTPFDMCTAAIRATNASSLEGVQKINGLWRLYFKDRTTRLELCISQRLLVNGINVPLYDKNPYTSGQQQLQSFHRVPAQVNDKLTIKDYTLICEQ